MLLRDEDVCLFSADDEVETFVCLMKMKGCRRLPPQVRRRLQDDSLLRDQDVCLSSADEDVRTSWLFGKRRREDLSFFSEEKDEEKFVFSVHTKMSRHYAISW